MAIRNILGMAIWYILWPFGIFYDHLVNFMDIWYILWPFMDIWYILWPQAKFLNFKSPKN
jgi:hypothetical protein